jgi:hypothetical protein
VEDATGEEGAPHGIDLEVRLVPPPGSHLDTTSHARVRVLGSAHAGLADGRRILTSGGLSAREWRQVVGDDRIVIGGIEDGRTCLDWWIPSVE